MRKKLFLIIEPVNNDNKLSNIYDFVMMVKYSLQGTTQGRYLTGGVPPVRFSM